MHHRVDEFFIGHWVRVTDSTGVLDSPETAPTRAVGANANVERGDRGEVVRIGERGKEGEYAVSFSGVHDEHVWIEGDCLEDAGRVDFDVEASELGQ
jgi:hypothetical protein